MEKWTIAITRKKGNYWREEPALFSSKILLNIWWNSCRRTERIWKGSYMIFLWLKDIEKNVNVQWWLPSVTLSSYSPLWYTEGILIYEYGVVENISLVAKSIPPWPTIDLAEWIHSREQGLVNPFRIGPRSRTCRTLVISHFQDPDLATVHTTLESCKLIPETSID